MIEKQFEDEKTFYKQAQGNIATVMLPKKKIKQKTKQHTLWHPGLIQLYLKLHS